MRASNQLADVTTGVAPVITPLTGENSATSPDNPTIDAGLVKFNLTLTKTLEKKGTYKPGDEVSFALVPSNDGPVDALAGWSVTDVLPKGLTLVSMSGAGYTCTDASCMSDSVLPAGQEGAVIWVKAKITATGTGTLINVAYVAPAAGDIAETNPLVVPAQDTDTDASATDNDASAWLGFKTPPPPAPLAFTGASGLGVLLGTALVLLMLGVLLAGLARRKEEDISSLR